MIYQEVKHITNVINMKKPVKDIMNSTILIVNMCSPELLHPIPKTPVSILLLQEKGVIVHPSYTTLKDIETNEPNTWKRIQTYVEPITSWEHYNAIIDERTTLRMIASIITSYTKVKPYCFIKELLTNFHLSHNITLPETKQEVDDFLQTVPAEIPKYRNLGSFLPKKGPYVFQIYEHSNKIYHTLPENKDIKDDIIESYMEGTKTLYEQVNNIKSVVPCVSSQLTFASFRTTTLDTQPNLVYLMNAIQLSNMIPCIVHRPTLNEMQTKTKLFLPRIRSKWNKDEIQMLMGTTAITPSNKYTQLPKTGIFIWMQVASEPIGTTKGILQEKLENGDFLVKQHSNQAEIVVESTSISSDTLLSEVDVTLTRPIWSLLHIHPKGKCALYLQSKTEIKKVQEKITQFLPIELKDWKQIHTSVKFTVDTSDPSLNMKELPAKILASLSELKGCFVEKRSILHMGKKIKWFSKDDQAWKSGTIAGYPDIASYSIKTTRGLKTLPWTYVKEDKLSVVKKLDILMNRVKHSSFIHPLTTHINDLKDKGYSIKEIILNLHTFGISLSQASKYITDSLEESKQSNPGVTISIPFTTFGKSKSEYIFSGRSIEDITYAFRLFQVLLLLAKEKKVKTGRIEDEDDQDDMVPEEFEIGEDEEDDEDEDEDDLDIDLDDIDIDEELEEIEKEQELLKDPSLIEDKLATTTGLSIFLQSLYDKDPAIFIWSSGSDKKKDRFTTKCQEDSRHPKLMTDEVKLGIDQNHDGAYNTWSFAEAAGDTKAVQELQQSEKTCDGLSESVRKGESCVAIYHGSSEKKYWYICPRIYDLLEQKPLRLQDLEFEIPYTPSGWKRSEWRTSVEGNDILTYGPSYKGRKPTKNFNQSDYNEYSLYFAPESTFYFYPGFLDSSTHPKLLQMPCCFKTSNKRLEELYGIEEPKKTGSTNYIQGWKKALGWNPPRLGVIPPLFRKLFNVDPIEYGTGTIQRNSTSKHPLWLRRGVPISANPFISCLANSLNDGTTETDIRRTILSKLTRRHFETLNHGLIQLAMTDPAMKKSAFDNYRNHILFGQNLSWLDILDAYSLLINNKFVFILLDTTNTGSPSILNTSQANYHEKGLQTLYHLQKRKSPEASEWKVFFLLKDNLQWTPIYRITPNEKSYTLERGLSGSDEHAIYWVQQRVRKVNSKPYQLYNQIQEYPTPFDYMKIFQSLDVPLNEVNIVRSDISSVFSIGLYHEKTGLLPFFAQTLNPTIQSGFGKPIGWSSVQPIKTASELIELYKTYKFQLPFKAIVTSTDNTYMGFTTIFGVDIPILPNKKGETIMNNMPTLMTTKENWHQSVIMALQGITKQQTQQLPTIQSVLRNLYNLELQYGKLSSSEKKQTIHFIPYHFNESTVDHSIQSLTMRLKYNSNIIDTLTIPVRPQVLEGGERESIREKVGIKMSDANAGVIRLPKNTTIENVVRYLSELRQRSGRSISVGPIQYLFSMKKLIGVEDECGTKYILHSSQTFPLYQLDESSNQFRLKPLYLAKYVQDVKSSSFEEETSIIASLMIELMKIPYWKKQLAFLQEKAVTSNIWKNAKREIIERLQAVVNEIHKRRPDISKDTIQIYMNEWVAQIGWNDTMRMKLKTNDLEQSISTTQIVENEKELLVSGPDIMNFYKTQFNITQTISLQLVEKATETVSLVSISKEQVKVEDSDELETTDKPITVSQQTTAIVRSIYHKYPTSDPQKEREGNKEVILFTREASKRDDLIIRVPIGKTSSIIRGIVKE